MIATTGSTVQATLRQFMSDVFFVDNVDPEASFLEQGIIDSLGVVELVAFVERTYGIKCADEDLVPENLDSLNRVAAFVERKRSA